MSPNDALKIIECLANGADPETGELLHEQSPLNNPNVVRALFVACKALDAQAKRGERKQELPENAGRPWSDGEDRELLADFDAGVPNRDLAARHRRTQGAIASRLVRLGRIKDRAEVYTRKPPSDP